DEHLASALTAVPTHPEDADPRVGGPGRAYVNAFGLTGPDGLRRDVAAEVSVREAADMLRGPGEPPGGRARVSVLGRDGRLGALRGDQPAKRSGRRGALRAGARMRAVTAASAPGDDERAEQPHDARPTPQSPPDTSRWQRP